MTDFTATIDAWVKTSEARMKEVFKESAKRTVSVAQSRIPVDTGYARASVQASLQSMPAIDSSAHGAHGQKYSYDGGEVTATIAGAELGGQIYVGWTAAYVGKLEYGHSKQAPSGFVRISAMEWPRIVSEVVAEAKARVAA